MGGGLGADENYSNWNERDCEGFSNYSSVGKGDTLAWIYMKDKAMNFLFGNIFKETSDEFTLEDGRDSPYKRRRTNGHQQAMELGTIMGKHMETGFSLVPDAFKTINTIRNDTNTGLSRASNMLSSALDLIHKTQSQIQDFEDKIRNDLDQDETSESNVQYLGTLKKTLKKAFQILENVNVSE